MRHLALLSCSLAVAVSAHVARADAPAGGPISAPTSSPPGGSGAPAEPVPVSGQRSIGVAAEIGFNTGLGAAVHLGTRQFGFYAAGGILPVFVFGNEQNATRSLTFDVYRAFALNLDAYALVIRASPRADVGLSGGYSANTLLGSGANLGVAVRYDLGEKLAFTLFGGFTVFPDARGRLAAHGYPSTQDASVPYLQGGANLGIAFYP